MTQVEMCVKSFLHTIFLNIFYTTTTFQLHFMKTLRKLNQIIQIFVSVLLLNSLH